MNGSSRFSTVRRRDVSSLVILLALLLISIVPIHHGFVIVTVNVPVTPSSRQLYSRHPRYSHKEEESDHDHEKKQKSAIITTAAAATTTTTRRAFFGAMSWSSAFAVSNMPIGYADSSTVVSSTIMTTTPALATTTTAVVVPLTYTGQELLISYVVDGDTFRGIFDTGSPFLMIPGSCGYNTKRKSGCYNDQGRSTDLEPTIEIFDGFEGEVTWKIGTFDFANATTTTTTTTKTFSDNQVAVYDNDNSSNNNNSVQTSSIIMKNNHTNVIFGVASEDIMGGPGGVFFGMIRDTDPRIRPSFLGQTTTQAFQVNLVTSPRTVTLSNQPLIDPVQSDYVPMTNILRRRYGDPVGHYTARAKRIEVNGCPLLSSSPSSSIFVIFDTGVTGMLVSRGLFDENYSIARKQKSRSLFGTVSLTFETARRKEVTLRATKPITTPFDPEDTWKRFPKGSHLIVLGLAFLEGHVLTIDIDKERLWLE